MLNHVEPKLSNGSVNGYAPDGHSAPMGAYRPQYIPNGTEPNGHGNATPGRVGHDGGYGGMGGVDSNRTPPPADEGWVPERNPTSPAPVYQNGGRRMSAAATEGEYLRPSGLPGPMPIPTIDPRMAGAMGLDPFAAAAATAAYNEALAMRAGMIPMAQGMQHDPLSPSRLMYTNGGLASPQSPGMHGHGPIAPGAHPLLLQQQLAAAAGQLTPNRYAFPSQHYYPTHLPSPPQTRSPHSRKRTDLTIHTDLPARVGPVSAPAMVRGVLREDLPSATMPHTADPDLLLLSPSTATATTPKIDRDLKKLSLYKTELCRSWEETGYCRYGTKCQFAHSEVELRPVDRHPKYKTEMCKTFWEKGTCPYGKRCCFIHTERDVEKKMSDIEKKLIVLKKPEEKSPGSVVEGMARSRTMSSGSVLSIEGEDEIPTKPFSPYADSTVNVADLAMMHDHNHHYMYDPRAIADAYFAGRRYSDVGTPESYAPQMGLHPVQEEDDVGELGEYMRNVRLDDHSRSDDEDGLSTTPPPQSVMRTMYPHHFQPHTFPGELHYPLQYEPVGGVTHLPAPPISSTPPRERTRRSRSVTQPAVLVDGGYAKNRSESFSGYLPGTPPHQSSAAAYLMTHMNAAAAAAARAAAMAGVAKAAAAAAAAGEVVGTVPPTPVSLARALSFDAESAVSSNRSSPVRGRD
ncbi:hypothetical protein HK104_011176 [Borealophlyctis nickersoniae]|nr:hypothetical protein HK104_011176 [Borealophlyctis nickersoniae]